MPFADIDGLKIHFYTQQATATEQRRLMYVHGTGCNARLWLRHMRAIAASHTSVAIDLPGHGRSTGLGFRGAADYAHYCIELANYLEWDEFVLVGHSLGGAIALTVASYDAERLSGLVLVDTGARLRVSPDVLESARRVAAGMEPLPQDPHWSYAPSTPQSVIDEIAVTIKDTDPVVTYRDWIADDSFDFMSRIQHIAVPTFAICGAQDELTPMRNHLYFRDTMPDCELAVIESSGHWPYYEQPVVFDETVATFLQQLMRPQA